MIEKPSEVDTYNWRLPLAALLATPVLFLIFAVFQPESLVYGLFVVPFITILLFLWAMKNVIAKRNRRFLAILSMLAIFWVLSVPLFRNHLAIRSAARWLIWSTDYKAKVTAQPPAASGDLKHLDWDGWGWAGMNTEVYLVLDPSDSLAAAAKSHQPGKFNGLPCEVDHVLRLERNWYAAQFYTATDWNHCN